MPAIADDLIELALDAIRRMPGEAEYARIAPYEPNDGTPWRPKQGSCHSNVATLVYKYSNLRHVYGHLIFPPSLTRNPDWIVAAHSLAEDGSMLCEFTPGADTRVPFVRYRGTEEQLPRFREAFEVRLSKQQVEDYLRANSL